ncbi:TauD/TfdA family dioxygenase [Kitasatospora aureofaciens]|uniref:TauD/TfdA family dioxygenase n=1 Tax=Kitasatospora aureofaciens TaxID=1894 RepID=UPI001C47A0D7|nr:TauD/TfdA family dioxygenase [Kitasatospora aureofaciens]MBV6701801.1 TauD/TfdA family dioxygenase [Kitasatospora aureofaciens]
MLADPHRTAQWPPRLRTAADTAAGLEHRFGALTGEDLTPPAAQREALAEALTTVPGLGALQRELVAAVRDHGAAVLTGVPWHDGSLIALSACLGVVTAEDNGSPCRMVWDIREDPQAPEDPHAQQRDRFDLHTDSTFSARPHDTVGMVCVEPAADGSGRTLLLTADRLVQALRATGHEGELARLCRPDFPFGPGHVAGTPPHRAAVLRIPDGPARVRYRFDLLHRAVGHSSAHNLAAAEVRSALAALAAVETVLADPRLITSLLLGRGDYLVLDNSRVLHGRSAVTASTGRHLRRLKLRDRTAANPTSRS